MAPKEQKQKTAPRRHSLRLEQKKDADKKRTNLKDILKSSQRSKRKSGIESDGDFMFKRSASGLRESSTQKSTRTTKPKKIRKLTQEDVSITPVISRSVNYEEASTSVQVALPISDTPIIRRNKEIRNGGNRRSSLGNRGKRVSSVGNGYQATPHDKVPTTELYKHLNSDLPDPHKMRQLLSWCSQRIFELEKDRHIKQKNKLPNEELTALNIAKVIKEEIVRDLINGKIGISWWNKNDEETEETEKVLLPNKKNINNLKVLEDFKIRLEGLKRSCKVWEKLNNQIELPNEISLDKVSIPNNEEIKKLLDSSILEEFNKIEDSTLDELSNLEIYIDEFNSKVHKLKSSSSIRQKFIDSKNFKLSQILDSTFNDESINKITRNDKEVDTEKLLKGISRIP